MEKDTFLKEYNNPNNTVYDVKRKLGLNNHQYSKIYHELKLNEVKRHMNYTGAKHTSKLRNGKITIRKWINGNKEYVGVYKTQEDADIVVEVCEQHNWDLNNPTVEAAINEYRIKPKNYSKIGNRYYVYRTIQGKRIYYDSFTYEVDAQECVDLLEKLDWNKTVYEELKVLV